MLVALAASACVNLNDDEPSVTVWETQLVAAIAFPEVVGQAAVVSGPDGTAMGIAMEGAEPQATHAWGLWTGTCDQPGQQVGPDTDYPQLDVDATGSAEAQTHLAVRLAYDGTYHVEVRLGVADPTRVACGDLAQP
jgi:hypothetical protein